MRTAIFALAAALMAMSASAASALPAANPGLRGAAATEHVVYKKNWKHNNNVRHRDNDHRYDKYRGWNRYNSRPRGWRNRGCVAVGPIWFCK